EALVAGELAALVAADTTTHDSLQPGVDVDQEMSADDRRVATEVCVRARLLTEARTDRGVGPLARHRANRVRRRQLTESLGRLGLPATAQSVAERRQLLRANGYGDVVDIARRYVPVRWQAPQLPTASGSHRPGSPPSDPGLARIWTDAERIAADV